MKDYVEDPATTTTNATATTDRLTDALPLPVADITPEIGGFAPVHIMSAVKGLIEMATDTAGRVLDLLGQMWGALNGRGWIPGHPAVFSRDTPIGNWTPGGANYFRIRIKGRRYKGNAADCTNESNPGTPVDTVGSQWFMLNNGALLTVGYWPEVQPAPFSGVPIYMGESFLYGPGPNGSTELLGFGGIAGMPAEGAVWIEVQPAEGAGVPYPATTPAVEPIPDPVVLFPQVPAPEPLAAASTTAPAPVRPRVLPLSPSSPGPARPAQVPDAQPITQPQPGTNSPARQVTTTTGALTGILAASRPRIAPLPAGPIPGLEPFFTPDARPVPKAAPAPITTAQDARQYGTQTITSGAPATSPEAIANEIGRIERKLGLMLPMSGPSPSWLDDVAQAIKNKIIGELLDAIADITSGGSGSNLPQTTYSFVPPYDTANDTITNTADYDIPADKLGPAVVSRLDAIAAALQLTARWRVKPSKGNKLDPNITITAFGTPD